MGKQKSRQAEERRATGDWRRRKVKGSERKRAGWGGEYQEKSWSRGYSNPATTPLLSVWMNLTTIDTSRKDF